MGAADIIPGVSGGTIAFVTGIYEELIEAIRSVNFRFVILFFKGFSQKKFFNEAKVSFFTIHFRFLIPLMIGIAASFVLLANIIGPIRDQYPTYSAAFFFGLVLASAVVVYLTMGDKKFAYVFLAIIVGFIVGFGIVGLEAVQSSHSVVMIFFAGSVTVCAMILPGISGAFILWLLGQYDFMLEVLRQFIRFDWGSVVFVVVYLVGGLVGLLSFSRLLSFLLRRYRMVTVSFLLGLMIGALRKPGEIIFNSSSDIFFILMSLVFGVLVVAVLGFFSLRKNEVVKKNLL